MYINVLLATGVVEKKFLGVEKEEGGVVMFGMLCSHAPAS